MHLSADAYAKINLTLDILEKREDGYHLLKMIMQSVSLSDRVSVRTEDTGRIALVCSVDGVPCDESNTAYRAARAFFEAAGIENEGLSIKIKKRIPFGAGLGGGSADAAAVIRILDVLYETKLSDHALLEIGEKVGADVPFCLTGGTMLAEGIGNILLPLPDLEDGFFVIVKPAAHSATGAAYRRWDELESTAHPDTEKAAEAIFEHDLRHLGEQIGNVFEEVVEGGEEREEIKRVMREHGALGASLSGSGSAVFGFFETKSDAEDCKKALEERFEEVFLCRPESKGIELL